MITRRMVAEAWTALGKKHTDEEARAYANELQEIVCERAQDRDIAEHSRLATPDGRWPTDPELRIKISTRAYNRALEQVLEEYLNAPVRDYLEAKDEEEQAALRAEADRQWEEVQKHRWEESDDEC